MDDKQTTVSSQVPDTLRRRAKVKAAQQDKSLSRVIRELLERWLSSNATPGKDSPPTIEQE